MTKYIYLLIRPTYDKYYLIIRLKVLTNNFPMDYTDLKDNVKSLSKEANAVSRNMVSQTPRHHTVENLVTVWLDSTIDESSNDYQSWIDQLRRTVNLIETFNNQDRCVDFIRNVKNQKVFMILSGNFDEMLISLIHDTSQLDSIYIFDMKLVKHEQLLKERRKIKGVFSDISLICNHIKQNARQCEHNLTPMSIVSAFHILDLNELDPSFMYSQLLKEILLEIQYDKEAKQKFVNFLKMQYAENKVTLNSIDKFEYDYDNQSPIWWYTKELFIYSLLNRALRTQDIEIIIMMGFFIRDLSQQIEKIYLQTRQETNTIVYRGQVMTNAEFEKIKQNQNGLLAFNNFLSTTTDPQVALVFVQIDPINPDLTGIFFRIEINSSISSTPFAPLRDTGYYLDEEEEILFSMHAVFRISNIQHIADRVWQVNLTLTADNDEQLKRVTDYMRQEIGGGTQRNLLGRLLIKMGKFEKAEEVFKMLIESTSDNDLREIAQLQCHLGHVKYLQGDAATALIYYETALEIRERILLPTDLDLAKTYSSMGTIYSSIGNYSNSLLYHEKALQIREKTLTYNDPDLGKTYSNMGAINYRMGNYSNALQYYEKALEIRQKSLPPTHPDLANTYNNIAALQRSLRNYSGALSSYEKALNIEQKSLPPTHADLATTYNNIAVLYMSMEDYSGALTYLERTLKIQQSSLSSTHPDLASTYSNIGGVYTLLKDYSIALSYFEKALQIQQKSLSPIHPAFAKTFTIIGQAYDLMQNYPTALSYYEKALEIQQKSLQPLHPDLAITHYKIGNVLKNLGRCKETITHAERAVDIAPQAVGSANHSNFQTFQNDMEHIHQKLN